MDENRYIEDIQYEIKKQPDIFHDHAPISFAYLNSPIGVNQHFYHVHPNIEVYFCISPYIDYIVNDKYYILSPGDIVIIKPNEVHKVVIREPHLYARFFLTFPTDSLPDHLLPPLTALLNSGGGKAVRLRPSEKEWENICTLLHQALSICRESVGEGQSMLMQTKVHALCLQILCSLCEYTNRALPAERRADGAELSELLADVYIYIEKHLKEIQNVAQIAKALYVSPSYLSTLFRKHMGVPLVYHLQSLKMSLAKQLLEEGYSVADTCHELGYTDCSYFIRVFKRHMGMTPLKYRATFCAGKEDKPVP